MTNLTVEELRHVLTVLGMVKSWQGEPSEVRALIDRHESAKSKLEAELARKEKPEVHANGNGKQHKITYPLPGR